MQQWEHLPRKFILISQELDLYVCVFVVKGSTEVRLEVLEVSATLWSRQMMVKVLRYQAADSRREMC